MKSFQLVEPNEPLALVESETPVPVGTQVLLRVKACGVCHSDLHFWQGGYDLGGGKWMSMQDRGIDLPLVMGHEALGEVVALGPDAAGVTPGQTRLVFPWIGCGACPRCAEGNENDCTKMRSTGVFAPGGYADHILVPDARYLLDVSGIDEHYACTLACAGITSYSALKKAGPLSSDDKLVIIGAGGVGMSGVGIAAKYHAGHEIIVLDLDDEKLAQARQAGASHTINPGNEDALARIRDLTGGTGAGAIVDFVASGETARLGFEATRKGGRYVAVGLFGGEFTTPTLMLPARNLTMRGSYVGKLDEMAELLDLVRGGGVTPIPVAARPMTELTRTLADIAEGRIVGRVVVVP